LFPIIDVCASDSDLEAAQSRDALQSLVEELMRSNHDISQRLRSIEDNFESRSILTTCFRNGTMDELAEGESGTHNDVRPEASSIERSITGSSLVVQSLTEDTPQNGFQVDLGSSRVYQRTELYESDVSFTSSAVRTHAWSVFSGLSLSEVSMISAVALPLYLDEISNIECYAPSRLAHANLRVTTQMTNESIPLNSAADILPDSASGTTLDSVVQFEWGQGLKKPRSRLFSWRNRIMGSNEGVMTRKIRNSPSTYVSSNSVLEQKNLPLYKLVVLGDRDVGKTELTIQVSDSV